LKLLLDENLKLHSDGNSKPPLVENLTPTPAENLKLLLDENLKMMKSDVNYVEK
jgi:hypothetical protein